MLNHSSKQPLKKWVNPGTIFHSVLVCWAFEFQSTTLSLWMLLQYMVCYVGVLVILRNQSTARILLHDKIQSMHGVELFLWKPQVTNRIQSGITTAL